MAELLPEYDPLQRAFHRAFAAELALMIDDLPLPRDSRLLDVPCGDGFYTQHLARRLRPGAVRGIDANERYLAEARDRCSRLGLGVRFDIGDAYALPLGDGTVDAVFCALSFVSLGEHDRALKEMRRVLAVGGRLHVVESDEYHHVLLPWPVDLEVAVTRALRDALAAKHGDPAEYSPARDLQGAIMAAGFSRPAKTTHTADRAAPFSEADVEFLRRHLDFLRETARPFLSAADKRAFDRCLDPNGGESFFRRDDATMTVLFARFAAQS